MRVGLPFGGLSIVGRSSTSRPLEVDFFLASRTVHSLTPKSSAIATFDFRGFAAIASAARCPAGIYIVPRLQILNPACVLTISAP